MRSFVAAVLLAFVAGLVGAQGVLPVPPLTGRVIDQTGTLTPVQAEALTKKLAAIETAHGSQLVILIVPTTAPEDVASFAQRVGEQWKVGRKDVGDGLIIVVAKNDRAVQIQVAKALQGAVPDIAAGRIIQQQIVPAFRAGDFAGGLNTAVDRLGERIASEGLPQPNAPRQGGGRRDSPLGGGFDFQSIAIFLFIFVPIVGGILKRMMGSKLGTLATGAAVGGLGWLLTTSLLIGLGVGVASLLLVGLTGGGGLGGRRGGGGPIIWGGGGGGFGGGFGGGGGGGGFSSGGGGSFDGGGASGRW